jgi:hypothetical protein
MVGDEARPVVVAAGVAVMTSGEAARIVGDADGAVMAGDEPGRREAP